MTRPDYVTNEDIERWQNNIDNDPTFPKEYAEEVQIKEVCFAGLWLVEKLQALDCPDEIIARIQFTAGSLSFR